MHLAKQKTWDFILWDFKYVYKRSIYIIVKGFQESWHGFGEAVYGVLVM